MNNHPSGTVTVLFTDIKGRTILMRRHLDGLPALSARQNEILSPSNGIIAL